METNKIILPEYSKSYLNENPNSYRITTDGGCQEISPKDGKFFTLEEMCEYCNSRIVEFIFLPFDMILVVDEEGALKRDRKINWIATKIVSDVSGGTLNYFIYGNAMLIKEKEVE